MKDVPERVHNLNIKYYFVLDPIAHMGLVDFLSHTARGALMFLLFRPPSQASSRLPPGHPQWSSMEPHLFMSELCFAWPLYLSLPSRKERNTICNMFMHFSWLLWRLLGYGGGTAREPTMAVSRGRWNVAPLNGKPSTHSLLLLPFCFLSLLISNLIDL